VLERLYGSKKGGLIRVWMKRYDFGSVLKLFLKAAVRFVI
jgi:hypothetical protein